MREILFRGKRPDNGEWVYSGTLIHFDANTENETCFMPMRGDTSLCVLDENYNINQVLYAMYYNVIPETVGQYTGLTDENGKKIFEGDVVTMPAYGGGRHKAVVYFEGGKFAVDGSNWSFKDISPTKMQVIGNIHDNPELMAGDTND